MTDDVIAGLFVLLGMALCGACSEPSLGGTAVDTPDATMIIEPTDDTVGAGDAAIPTEDPCLSCEMEGGEVICRPKAVGDICQSDDCCVALARCQPCPDDHESCPQSGLQCVGQPSLDCGDGDPCTTDRASCGADGVCTCQAEPAVDGTPCTFDKIGCRVGDACLAGACVAGPSAELDDGNPCTTGVCIKGVVEHQGLNEGQCDDGNECTTEDTCVLGTCTGGPAVTCEPPPCAGSASCVPGEGCVPSCRGPVTFPAKLRAIVARPS